MSEDAPTTAPTESAAPPAEQAPEARTYSQEDFDRIVGRIRTEEREKFADYTTLKEKAERYDEAANAAKTAEEKLQEQLADRERELEQLRESSKRSQVASAVASAAVKHGLVDPDAAVKLIDWDEIQFEEDKPANVDQLVADLVEAKPYLAQKSKPSSFDGGPRTPAPKTTDDPKAALGAGLLAHLRGES